MIVPSPILAVVLAAFLASPAPASPAAGGAALPGVAAPATPVPAPTRDPLAYDDPGMHFRAPDGWKRIDLGGVPSDSAGAAAPAAAYVFAPGRSESRTILIQIEPFEGTLEGLVHSRESELRSTTDGTFIDHETKVTLANGMPAYFLQVSQPGGPAGNQLRRYDYIVYDLTRSIDVAYIGRYGDFDEKDVRAALASLSVVVYPRHRS